MMIQFNLKKLLADKEFREKRRILLKEISDITGLSRTTLSKISNSKGDYKTSSYNIEKLCRYFNCSLDQFMTIVNDRDNELSPNNKFPIVDYTEKYKPLMHFDKNKTSFIHRWYPFVEGYSKDFIQSIIEELDYTPKCCLDPFVGSGTTPVELQELGIKCVSYEVSPFMHLLSKVKMRRDYTLKDFNKSLVIIKDSINNYHEDIEKFLPIPPADTIVENDNLKKWIFNKDIMKGILDIKYSISLLNDTKYKNLFKIALSSILLEGSNVFRNGKCLSYKKDWKNSIQYKRADIHNMFLTKIENIFLPDIKKLDQQKNKKKVFSNYQFCYLGDVRKKLSKIDDESIDLVITSPPYLNSRDYTDIYRVELWVLDLIKDYEAMRELRKKTLRSHVQLKMDNVDLINVKQLKDTLSNLYRYQDKFWNKDLPNMIKGYFEDIDNIFKILRNKMISEKKVYLNVANSAYYGVEIRVDEIIAEIAEIQGFIVDEIREVRQISPSSQQKDQIESLRESVIVMTKS